MSYSGWKAGDRAKVISKDGPDARTHYGRVGTVAWFVRGRVRLRFSDGSGGIFDWDELRNVTRRKREESA